MFDHKHYVPIIPWKMGERIALRELFESDRQGIVPLTVSPARLEVVSGDSSLASPTFLVKQRDHEKFLPRICPRTHDLMGAWALISPHGLSSVGPEPFRQAAP